jgi:hypothetical protein
MTLLKTAENHVLKHHLARTIVHSINRWLRLGGPPEAANVTPEAISAFRIAAGAAGLSVWTSEKTITDVITSAKLAGVTVDRGRRVRRPHPEPVPAPADSIDAMWPHLATWSRQLVAICFWTGLRLNDAIGAHLLADWTGDIIRWEANKTHKKHVWPLPDWLKGIMSANVRLPYREANDHAQTIVRGEFDRCCRLAKIDRLTPIQLRQRAVTEWTRAHAKAGEIVHGCGLGVMKHYIQTMEILEGASPRVRLPACFGAAPVDSAEAILLTHFRRLDPAAQSLITGTVERLSAG